MQQEKIQVFIDERINLNSNFYNIDGFVKSQVSSLFVIPAKAGIQ